MRIAILRTIIYLGVYELIIRIITYYTDLVAFVSIVQCYSATLDYLKDNTPPFEGYWSTILRWICLFPVAVFFGLACGVIVGSLKKTRGWIGTDLDFWRTLPAILVYFFVSALLGDNIFTRTMPAWYVTFFTVSYFSFRATVQLDERRIWHLHEIGAGWFFILKHCLLYEIAHTVFIGIRQSVSLSFVLLITTELIVGASNNEGIGATFLNWSYQTHYALMLYGLLVTGITGYLLNYLTTVRLLTE